MFFGCYSISYWCCCLWYLLFDSSKFSDLNINSVFYLLFLFCLCQPGLLQKGSAEIKLLGNLKTIGTGLEPKQKKSQNHSMAKVQGPSGSVWSHPCSIRARVPKPVSGSVCQHSIGVQHRSAAWCSFFRMFLPMEGEQERNTLLITTCTENPAILRLFSSLFLLSSSRHTQMKSLPRRLQ